MRKFYLLLISMFALAMCAFSQEQTSALSAIGSTSTEAVSTVYNDAKSAVSTVYTDVSSLSGTIYDEVKSAVISIGKGIGCAAEHVYSIIVKKYIVEGISELCYFLFGIIILIFGLVKTNKYFKDKERIDWRCIFPFGLLTVSIIILSTTEFSDMLVNLINPEWKALEYIIDTAKGMVK
jgi:hypothetical protein